MTDGCRSWTTSVCWVLGTKQMERSWPCCSSWQTQAAPQSSRRCASLFPHCFGPGSFACWLQSPWQSPILSPGEQHAVLCIILPSVIEHLLPTISKHGSHATAYQSLFRIALNRRSFSSVPISMQVCLLKPCIHIKQEPQMSPCHCCRRIAPWSSTWALAPAGQSTCTRCRWR